MLGERKVVELKIQQFVSARKQELTELSEVAEQQDYETLLLKKFDLTSEVHAYFLGRLDAGDMLAIKELVRVFCKNYGKVSKGEMPISAILPCEPFDYIETARKMNRRLVVKIFADDKLSHAEELKNIRKVPRPI